MLIFYLLAEINTTRRSLKLIEGQITLLDAVQVQPTKPLVLDQEAISKQKISELLRKLDNSMKSEKKLKMTLKRKNEEIADLEETNDELSMQVTKLSNNNCKTKEPDMISANLIGTIPSVNIITAQPTGRPATLSNVTDQSVNKRECGSCNCSVCYFCVNISADQSQTSNSPKCCC